MSQKNMPKKNIEFQSHKALSHDEKEMKSSQHSKFKKIMADQLRGEMCQLIKIKDEAHDQVWKSHETFQKFKAMGDEKEAEYYWMSYQTWKQQHHRLTEKILVKLKAVQKFESSSRNMEQPKMIVDQKDYIKYGPSDEED